MQKEEIKMIKQDLDLLKSQISNITDQIHELLNLLPKNKLQNDLNACNKIDPDQIICTQTKYNEWDVLIKPLPGSNPFNKSFQEFKAANNYQEDGIHLVVIFPETYPNECSFIYNSTPILSASHIYNGCFGTWRSASSYFGKKIWKPTLQWKYI